MRKIDKHLEQFLLSQPNGVILSCSLGKDSIAVGQVLRELGVKFDIFYFYRCPELNFVHRTIDVYESIFEKRIIRLPHPLLLHELRNCFFQPIDRYSVIERYKIPTYTMFNMIINYFKSIGVDETKIKRFHAVGTRAAESFKRRKDFERNGAIRPKKLTVMPIWNWTNEDVYSYLRDSSIPLAEDYRFWRRSFDDYNYQYITELANQVPDDYQTLCEYFPLLPAELRRYEFNQQYMG